jgi:uncharacterized protein YdeI (YjbR/CyaY-like superfamily)
MKKSRVNPKVDAYFREAEKWREEMAELRKLMLDCRLTEELKWGKPCYTFQGRNVVLIVGFKACCALLFCKGALLKDAHGILIKPGENTQATRQVRFAGVREIVARRSILRAMIHEAIAAEKAGLEVVYDKNTELVFPEEFQRRLDGNPALRAAFGALTPGRRRAYNLYFSAAKQSKTRASRIEKCLPQILQGKGLNDRYLQTRKLPRPGRS